MKFQEAKLVIKILLSADDDCEQCARVLIDDFIQVFPEFAKIAEQSFHDYFYVNLRIST